MPSPRTSPRALAAQSVLPAPAGTRRLRVAATVAAAALLGTTGAVVAGVAAGGAADAAVTWTCTAADGSGTTSVKLGPATRCTKETSSGSTPTAGPAPSASASPAPTAAPTAAPSPTSSPAAGPAPTASAPPSPAPAPSAAAPATTVAAALNLPSVLRGPSSALAAVATYDRLLQVGQLTQSALDAAPNGTVFGVAGGVHRLTAPLRPKPGQSFVGLPGAVISGAALLTGWTASGSTWYVGGQTQQFPVRDNGGYNVCLPSAPLCERVEDVYYDDVALRRVASLAEVTPGTYFFDDAADRIWLGSDPNGHRVETVQAQQAFVGVSGSTFRDLVVEKFGNAAQTGALQGSGMVVERSVVRLNHGTGIFGFGGRIVDSVVADNGQLGIGAGGAGQLVQDNEIARNGRAGYDPGWEAGGTKWANSSDLVVRGNWSHNNYGNGLWTDINNTRSLYEGNLVEDNAYAGILHEISYAATVRNNVARRNGTTDTYFNSRVGINVTNSRGVQVYGNLVQDNAGGGIVGVQDTRVGSGPEGTWALENLVVQGNDVRMRPNARGSYSGVWVYDTVADRASYYTSRGNVFQANRYVVSDPSARWFLGGDTLGGTDWVKTWSRWQQLGGDPGGSLVQG